MSLPIVLIHGRQQALAVREVCKIAELLVPKHVAITGGALFVAHLIEGIEPPPWVDCGPHRGRILGMIRTGIPRLIFDDERVYDKISEIAKQAGIQVTLQLQAPILMLKPHEISHTIIRIRLNQGGFQGWFS